jgi:predicted NBD/HSP70 family sugar kinase
VFASNRAALREYSESTAHHPLLTFQDLLSLAAQGDVRAKRALTNMAHYLGRGMRMIVAGLAPEKIVVIGDLTRSWNLFGPVIEAEIRAQVLPGGLPPQLVPAHEDGMARLRGTIALVLQRDFGPAPQVSV